MARIAVLMSGGVDSSAAALLLKQAGHELVGLTARLAASSSRCCDTEDLYRAQRICHKLDMPHVTLDLEREFASRVVTPFVRSYFDGLTPNPCAHCNREIKLGKILGLAIRSGFDLVATGHYAAVKVLNDRHVICEPHDRRKSQTYFLALVEAAALERVVFPLERLKKEDVRRLVIGIDLPVRDGESQDLCFIPREGYHRVLEERWDGPASGNVLDAEGNVVGTHRGHYAYTIGQRLGRLGRRYYVIEKRAATNEIIVADRKMSLKDRIAARDVQWFLPPGLIRERTLRIKYRYNSPAVPGRIVAAEEGLLAVATDEPCFAPAPGQILACYLDDCLVCGGIITSG
jgi:tRNA-specific 2-thiouridylase